MHKRRVVLWVWGLGMFLYCWVGLSAWSRHGFCAERTRPIHIGALTDSWGPTPPIVGLRDGLIGLGYCEQHDFVLGVRFTQGDRTLLTVAAAQMLEAGAELLFADSNNTAKALQHVTTHLPIVFASVEDPVGSGLVQSFAKPGGNITGVATRDVALAPKRLQVFHDLVPMIKRVLFLYDINDDYSAASAQLYQRAGQRLGLEVIVHTGAPGVIGGFFTVAGVAINEERLFRRAGMPLLTRAQEGHRMTETTSWTEPRCLRTRRISMGILSRPCGVVTGVGRVEHPRAPCVDGTRGA